MSGESARWLFMAARCWMRLAPAAAEMRLKHQRQRRLRRGQPPTPATVVESAPRGVALQAPASPLIRRSVNGGRDSSRVARRYAPARDMPTRTGQALWRYEPQQKCAYPNPRGQSSQLWLVMVWPLLPVWRSSSVRHDVIHPHATGAVTQPLTQEYHGQPFTVVYSLRIRLGRIKNLCPRLIPQRSRSTRAHQGILDGHSPARQGSGGGPW